MARYDPSTIQRIREQVDIVDYLSAYVNLKQRGQNYVGLCPFHQESTPSFNVSPAKQLYHCFGCGAGGDIFDLVMNLEGLSFPEAVERLASRAGITLEQSDDPAQQQRIARRKRALAALKMARSYFRHLLLRWPGGEAARDYVQQRGISEESSERFWLGYSADRWDGLLQALKGKGFEEEALVDAGLISESNRSQGRFYDRFRDRLMFPITSHRGQVVGFGGRIMGEGEPKYLNSPETIVFNKRHVLYGLSQAYESIRRDGALILTEGYMDVLSAHQFGFRQAVASLGTALAQEQVNLINRYADRVYVAYDGDAAGQKATLRGLGLLQPGGSEVRVVQVPPGQDVDDFLQAEGAGAFQQLLDDALPLVEYHYQVAISQNDVASAQGKAQVVAAVAPAIAQLESEVERAEYIRRFAQDLEVPEPAFRQEMGRLQSVSSGSRRSAVNRRPGSAYTKGRRGANSGAGGSNLQPREKLTRYARAERDILRILVTGPDQLLERLGALDEALGDQPMRHPVHAQLLQAIRELAEADERLENADGEPVSLVSALMAKLDEPRARRLVGEFVMREFPLDHLQESFSDCLEALKEYRVKRRIKQLLEVIRESEQQKKEVPTKYLQELRELQRRLKGKQG